MSTFSRCGRNNSLPRAPSYRVFVHRGTGNLGDAIQTWALCRLLGPRCAGVFRDEPIEGSGDGPPLVANGWLGYYPHTGPSNTVFAGVHVARHHREFSEWMKRSRGKAGARDPFTKDVLRLFGVASEVIGCATLTFDRYRGPRRGRIAVDVARDGCERLTNSLAGGLSWPEQWTQAGEMLGRIRRAEIVYTNRLHILLPCLAFGTPVLFPPAAFRRVQAAERLTLLSELPFTLDEPSVADVSSFAARYQTFLADALGPLRVARTPRMPSD